MASNFDPTTTPGAQTTKVAIVSAMLAGVRTGLGVTKGGASFNPNEKRRPAEYDGRRHIASGTIEPTMFGAVIEGTFAEFSSKTVGITTPGGTTASGVVTPAVSGLALAEGDLLTLPWYQIPLKDGTSLVYEFDFGYVDEYSIDTKDLDEATIKMKILAVVDSTRSDYSTDLPDYRRFRLDAAGNVLTTG